MAFELAANRPSIAAEKAALKVFVSYSRQDATPNADLIRDALNSDGFAALQDTHEILPGEPWKERLGRLIEQAGVVLFLISPKSIKSEICEWEVNEAERQGKRILPVVVVETPSEAIPPRLNRLHFVFLRTAAEADTGIQEIKASLRRDIDWVREHARLGELAAEWRRRGGLPELLLQGAPLSAAELWLSQSNDVGQIPTDEHRAFVAEGRAVETSRLAREREQIARTRRFQRRFAYALAAAVVVLAVGSWGVIRQSKAVAEKRALALAQRAKEAIDQKAYDRALRYALLAQPPQGALPWDIAASGLAEAEAQVSHAQSRNRLSWTVRDDVAKYLHFAASPTGHRIAAVTKSDLVILDGSTGKLLLRIALDKIEQGQEAASQSANPNIRLDEATNWENRLLIDPTGQYVVVCGERPMVVYSLESGQRLAGSELEADRCGWSGDGRVVAALGEETYFFDLKISKLSRLKLKLANEAVDHSFSRDGRFLLVVQSESKDERIGQDIVIWDITQAKRAASYAFSADITGAWFSPDGNGVLVRLAGIGDNDKGKLTMLDTQGGKAAVRFELSGDYSHVVFCDRDYLLLAGARRSLTFSDSSQSLMAVSMRDGSITATRRLHDDEIKFVSTAAFGRGDTVTSFLATSISTDGLLKQSIFFQQHDGKPGGAIAPIDELGAIEIGGAQFVVTDDQRTLTTLSRGHGIIRRWQILPSDDKAKLATGTTVSTWVRFNASGNRIDRITADGSKAEVFDTATGNLLATYSAPTDGGQRAQIRSLSVSPDGSYMVAGLSNGIIGLLQIDKADQVRYLKIADVMEIAPPPTRADSDKIPGSDESEPSAFPFDSSDVVEVDFDPTRPFAKITVNADFAVLDLRTGELRKIPAAIPIENAKLTVAGGRAALWHEKVVWLWTLTESGARKISLDLPVQRVILSPDGVRFLVVTAQRNELRDFSSANIEASMPYADRGIRSEATIDFSLSGNRLISQDEEIDRIVIRSADSGRIIRTVRMPPEIIGRNGRLTPDGRHLVYDVAERALVLSLETGRIVASYNTLLNAAVSADATMIVTRTTNGGLVLRKTGWLLGSASLDIAALCRDHLAGAEAFTAAELADPILTGEGRDPCNRGPGILASAYWAAIPGRMQNSSAKGLAALSQWLHPYIKKAAPVTPERP